MNEQVEGMPLEPEKPGAAPTPETPDEDEQESPDEQGEEPDEPEPEPPPPPPDEQPAGLSEKEIEARFDKLAKEKDRHAKRVGEILEEDAQSLIVCELCWPPTPGFRLEQMPEEQRSAVLSAIGFEPEPELEADKTARQCPDCKGYGKVKTGSKVSGFDAMVCQSCHGAGAVGERFAGTIATATSFQAQEPSNGEAALPAGTGEDAAVAQMLRDKGYTVMAPPVVTPA